jgi:hypothetical protein
VTTPILQRPYLITGIQQGTKIAVLETKTGHQLIRVESHPVALAVYQCLNKIEGADDPRTCALVKFILATKGTDLGKALAKTL